MIKSMLDSDLYKFSMQAAVLHNFPGVIVEYRFKCRSVWADLAQHRDEIERQIGFLGNLYLTPDEEKQVREKIPFLKPDYVDFLSEFRFNPDFVKVETISDTEIDIIVRGPWLQTIPFEVPILSIVEAVACKDLMTDEALSIGRRNLADKIEIIKAVGPEFKLADFGTRRRASFEQQRYVVETLTNEVPNNFVGTSNVSLALDNNIKPIGTMAHEWIQAMQGLTWLLNSQKMALDIWMKEYRGQLGIALSDCLGYAAFLRDFDFLFSKSYDGCRHDSGDPFEWGEKLIRHYESMSIDPKTKTAVFSDGLDMILAVRLFERFHGRIKVSFGIGTHLTNDLGFDPVQIVLKMVECNGQPVAKISDSSGKGMCNNAVYLTHLKNMFEVD